MMNDLLITEEIKIENMIYEIRGKQVMFAYDVARLYNVETKRINEVVKRNINRFPLDFCFKLTEEETKIYSSRSQFATLNKSNNLRGSNTKYLPYVFTEHGIMMLSGLLKSDIAAEVNKKIIIAFVAMRRYLSTNNYNQRVSIDNETLYHCGASFKELGKKCFAINKIDNLEILNNIIKI